MTAAFFWAIYVGGAFVDRDKPIKFGDRVFWPATLGEAAFKWALKEMGQ